LHPTPIVEIPSETARVAKVAFAKGTLATRLRDEFAVVFEDADFHAL
jgi:transposase